MRGGLGNQCAGWPQDPAMRRRPDAAEARHELATYFKTPSERQAREIVICVFVYTEHTSGTFLFLILAGWGAGPS